MSVIWNAELLRDLQKEKITLWKNVLEERHGGEVLFVSTEDLSNSSVVEAIAKACYEWGRIK